MDISFQPFQKKYAKQILDLILKIQNREYGIDTSTYPQPDLFNLRHYYQKGKSRLWVALSQGKVIGTIGLLDLGNHKGVVRKFFVHKEYRGADKGVSHKLLTLLCNWAKRSHIEDIYLSTFHFFQRAQRFYEKNGFEEIGDDRLPENFPFTTENKKLYYLRLE